MDELGAEVLDFIAADPAAVDEERFDELALRLWRRQLDGIPAYRRFCEQRLGRRAVDGWRSIPPLPTEAFKLAELTCAPPGEVRWRFTTSGTTGGRPGVAALTESDLAIMNEAIRRNAARMLFPDGTRCRVFVLAPPPEQAPHVVMAHGMRVIVDRFGGERSGFFVGASGLDTARLLASIDDAARAGAAVCLIGASFGFVHLLDAL